MKKDKLQEFADKSLSKYDNPAIREQFAREKVDGDVKIVDNRRRNWLLSVVAVMIIVALALGTYFLLTTPHKKHYLLENQQAHAVTVDETNAELSGFTVNDKFVVSCQQIDDTLYKEKLYYKINFTSGDTGETLEMIVVTNSDYNFLFNHKDYDKTNDSTKMIYTEQFIEQDSIYKFDSRGEFAIDHIKIYVTYNGLSSSTQSNFINFLQQCIELT